MFDVILIIIMFLFVLSVFNVIFMFKDLLEIKIDSKIKIEFKKKIMQKQKNLMWENYENYDVLKKINHIKERDKGYESYKNIVFSFIDYFSIIGSIVMYGIVLSKINVLFSLMTLMIFFMVAIFQSKVINIKFINFKDKVLPLNTKRNYLAKLLLNKKSRKEYHFNRLYDYISKKTEVLYDEEGKVFYQNKFLDSLMNVIANVLYGLQNIYVLGYIGYYVLNDDATIGTFVMVMTLSVFLNSKMKQLLNRIGKEKENLLHINELLFVMQLDEDPKINENEISKIAPKIEFIDVTYSYPQSNKIALKGIDICINNGEKIAIVGENGSGKTTFINMLVGLSNNYKGKILIDDIDLFNNYSILKNNISCILQDFQQYQMSVRENIQLGNLNYKFTDEEINTILKTVDLDSVFLEKEESIHTILGQLEKGVELSKGQWQKLAIARMLANNDSNIWILDEPTSFLDPISEVEVYKFINKISDNRTVIFISHRLGFAKNADRIIVFSDGEIVEDGRHNDLIKEKGIYYNMYETQKSLYTV